MARIYFDNAATTPMEAEVIAEMTDVMATHYANPSSIHAEGRAVRTLIERARKTVADGLNASVGEVFFTSGGTEANNMVLKGAVRDHGVRCILTSPLEHHCILHTLERLQAEAGIRLVYLPVSEKGTVSPEDLAQALTENADHKCLVSLMYANNEIGSVNPITELAQVADEHGALFHSDTVQAIGYFPFDLAQTPIHFLAGAAHKFHGPKGVGFVYINNDHQLKPLLDGGAQERNMRAGTENVYGIHGMAVAFAKAYEELPERWATIAGLNRYFREQLVEKGITHRINSPDLEQSHPKMLNVAFPPSEKADLMVLNLDIEGVSISGGSACSSGIEAASHVLAHLFPDDEWRSVRFSFSHHNTHAEVDAVIEKLVRLLTL